MKRTMLALVVAAAGCSVPIAAGTEGSLCDSDDDCVDGACIEGQCTSPSDACGDGSCAGGETCASCPADCGACPSCGDGTCGVGETCTSCPADCGAESTQAFCSRLGKNCDSVTAVDNCGTSRTVDCGSCSAPQTCGGGGADNVCGGGTAGGISIDNPYKGYPKWCRTTVHTHPSKLGGTTLLDAYRAAGYDVMFFTNHDYDGETTPPASPGLTVIQGEEISSPSHHNALGIASQLSSSGFQQSIDAAAAVGGLIQINHPSRDGITQAQVDALTGLWGIEVKNEPQNAPSDVVLWESQLAQRKKIWGTFSDDAHDVSDVGKGWLMVNTPSDCSATQVLANMKAGNFYDSEGPKLTVTVTGATVTVTSDTGARIDWYRQNGALIKTTTGASGSHTVDGTETYVRAVVTTSGGKVAWTMPLFVTAAAAPAEVTLQYEPSTEDLANPERGFMRQIAVFPEQTTAISMTRRDPSDSLVWVYFRLDSYVTRDLDAAALARIGSVFDSARAAGLKVVARISYNHPSAYSSDPSTWAADASLTQVLSHIQQLKPIWAAHSDVLAVLQAGFVGLWGEWHSSKSNLTDPVSQKAILDALASAVPSDRMLQVRYPKDKSALYGGPLTADTAFSGTTLARIGHHNDCFLAAADDEGTYRTDLHRTPTASEIQSWKSFISADGKYTPVGGETCAMNAPRSECPTATAELELMRWSFMNNGYDPDVLASWSTGGCMSTIRRRLGYRLVLTQATLPRAVAPGSAFDLEVQLKNEGYGAMFNPRPVHVMVDRDGVRYAARLEAVDPRRWEPGQTQTMRARVRLPTTVATGSWRLGLWLPDAASGLRSSPAYAVRFANAGVWDAAIGFNVLTTTFAVDATAPGMSDPTAPELSRSLAP